MERGMAIERVSDLLVAADPTALAQEAAKQILTIAEEAVTRRGSFSVVLAGGSTPRRLYSLLAAEPYCTHVPWSNTHLFWGDERAVPPEHPDSNFGMAKVALLRHVPIPANRVHRMPAERADLDAAAAEYENEIARTFAVRPSDEPPAFDLVLLGLGTDGHTASLFPHTPAIRETRQWVVSHYVSQLKASRLTLTAPILNRAATILFLVSGIEKATALQAIFEGPSDPERLPAQLIRPVTGRLVWLTDRAAAGRLSDRITVT
jgi:6-phosphogluconolactonase